ncbi:hypothetical protein BT93_K1950 [Corymbia citriodora subsp. variegata]|nr:hypothetical protein BT93_K1950 [Corymbia citriodora subsp. variegata]
MLSLEFGNHWTPLYTSRRSEGSVIVRLLEGFDLFLHLSIAISMTLNERCPSEEWMSGGESEDLNQIFPPKLAAPLSAAKTSLLKDKYFQDSIRMFHFWHEKATQVRGSMSRRSFKKGTLRQLREARWGRLRDEGQRHLADWLCFNEYSDKRLLMYVGYFYACWYS